MGIIQYRQICRGTVDKDHRYISRCINDILCTGIVCQCNNDNRCPFIDRSRYILDFLILILIAVNHIELTASCLCGCLCSMLQIAQVLILFRQNQHDLALIGFIFFLCIDWRKAAAAGKHCGTHGTRQQSCNPFSQFHLLPLFRSSIILFAYTKHPTLWHSIFLLQSHFLL